MEELDIQQNSVIKIMDSCMLKSVKEAFEELPIRSELTVEESEIDLDAPKTLPFETNSVVGNDVKHEINNGDKASPSQNNNSF